VSTADTRLLIEQAVVRFLDELPALKQLKLVIALELRARADAPVWRVEVPGPKVTRESTMDARITVSASRSHFNELAREGTLKNWVDAYERGHVKVSGDPAVIKLMANVISRHRDRVR
jgi:hypothetical protein